MSGTLGYVDVDKGVSRTLEELDSWLSEHLAESDVRWRVAFNERANIAFDQPSSDFLDLSVVGRITEQIPEIYATEAGDIHTPVFPTISQAHRRELSPEESEGHEEVLTRSVFDIHGLDEIDYSPDRVLEDIIDRHEDHGIVDGFGNAWSEWHSSLAAEAADHSLSIERPEVIVSFDVIRTMSYAFRHQDFLKYNKHEEGELIQEDNISFGKIVTGDPLSESALPEIDKVYIYQDKRVATSDYEISSRDIVESISDTVIGVFENVTLPDPSGRGLRAKAGHVAKLVMDEDEEAYHGFARTSPDVDISRVHDFYAALRVPKIPYLTWEMAQESRNWDYNHDVFGGWSAAEDGFVFHGRDERRGIRRQLFARKYWVIRGEKYRSKNDFEKDVEYLIELIESEYDCEVSWRTFDGTRISKTPIRQEHVLDKIREEAIEFPEQGDIIEAVSTPGKDSKEIEGIDGPLFPSDLSEFVADTSIIDAKVITRLISDGDLYGATVLIPDVVLEEIHRQIERGAQQGELGLEELKALRELSETNIIDLEILHTGERVESTDNVAVDQSIIRAATDRGVPLCSADATLLDFAEVAGVYAYPLNQELSRWGRLITNALKSRGGELQKTDLVRIVYEEIENSQISKQAYQREMFKTPDDIPPEDIATEMSILDEIEQLERRGEIYVRGEQVGLKEEVAIVPTLDALHKGTVACAISGDELLDEFEIQPFKAQLTVVIPESFSQWASLHSDPAFMEEIQNLEELEKQGRIQIERREILSSDTGVLLADEEQYSNIMDGLYRKVTGEFDWVAHR